MATTATRIRPAHDGRVRCYQWTLTAGETGDYVVAPHKADKTVHAWGTFGGVISIEGSLEDSVGAANFVVLTNPAGDALSGKTVAFLETVLQNATLIRPVAGSGVTAVTIRLMMGGP